jgi:hypothetical protein
MRGNIAASHTWLAVMMGISDAILPKADAKQKYSTILESCDLINLDAMNTSDAINSMMGVEVPHWALHYVSQLRVVHIPLLLFLALLIDYARMLYMRRRMVRFKQFTVFSTDEAIATRPLSVANMREHFQSPE